MRVVVLPTARREIHRLAPDIAARVASTIDAFEENPRPPGCQLLRDREPRTWRVRVGDWRILYDINDNTGVLTILRVLHRARAY